MMKSGFASDHVNTRETSLKTHVLQARSFMVYSRRIPRVRQQSSRLSSLLPAWRASRQKYYFRREAAAIRFPSDSERDPTDARAGACSTDDGVTYRIDSASSRTRARSDVIVAHAGRLIGVRLSHDDAMPRTAACSTTSRPLTALFFRGRCKCSKPWRCLLIISPPSCRSSVEMTDGRTSIDRRRRRRRRVRVDVPKASVCHDETR